MTRWSKDALLDPVDQKGFVSDCGYVRIFVNGRSVAKHRYLWQLKNGAIPKGSVLRCLGGDRQNTDPSNWELVSSGVIFQANMIMATDKLPKEFWETAVAVAKLKRRTADLKKSRSSSLFKAEGRTAD